MKKSAYSDRIRTIEVSFILIIPLFLSGCTQTSNPTTDEGNLSDPSIKPAVIFTLPANSATGPFDIYNPGSGSALPSFVVQFNKLMSTYSIVPGAITCKGFDQPVAVIPHSNEIIIYVNSKEGSGKKKNASSEITSQGHRSDKPKAYNNILELDIVDSEYATYASAPRMAYVLGKTYTITIDTSVQDINGNHLQTPYTFSFTPEPNFRVIESVPADNSKNVSITGGSSIGLLFNSPLQSGSASQLKLSPSPNGKWVIYSYDSTEAYFSTADTLLYNTTYTITAPASLKDNDGHQLGSNFSSSFTTTPFEVLSVNPANGSTGVSNNYSLSFAMSGPIDTSTLRSAFTISPGVAGYFSFYYSEPSYFYFTPTNGYAFNTKYTVTLSTGLKASNGTPLAAPYAMSFTTQSFEVSSTYPADGSTNWSSDQSITVYLSGPIDTSSVRSAFSISPSVAGFFSINPSSFEFTPTNGFGMGTTYAVSVSTALKAQDGTHLQSPYNFSFSTQPFEVTYTDPSNGETNVSPNYTINIEFNGSVDTSSIRQAFSTSPSVPGYFNSYYGSPYFTFTPNVSFGMNKAITVTISTAMKSQNGSHLSSPYSFSFSTQPFQVTGIYPSNGSAGVSRNLYDIQISCSATIDTSTIRSAFSINPSVSGTLFFYNGNDNFYFYPNRELSANTQYTVTVSSSLKAFDGTPLSQNYTSSFITGSN